MPWSREKQRSYLQARHEANRTRVIALARTTPCAGCGATPVEWHHDDHLETPRRRIAYLASHYAWPAVEAEIARCTPYCRRCHMLADGRLAALIERNGRGR